MKFEIYRDEANRKIRFHGEVTDADMAGLRLAPLDMACVNAPAHNAADWLQSLEIIFRNGEQS